MTRRSIGPRGISDPLSIWRDCWGILEVGTAGEAFGRPSRQIHHIDLTDRAEDELLRIARYIRPSEQLELCRSIVDPCCDLWRCSKLLRHVRLEWNHLTRTGCNIHSLNLSIDPDDERIPIWSERVVRVDILNLEAFALVVREVR